MRSSAGLWIIALLMAVSVFFLNGRPLFYFDTASYLEQGSNLLGLFGGDTAKKADPQAETSPAPEAAGPAADTPAAQPDRTVVGSRSVVYGVFLAVVVAVTGPIGVVVANLLIGMFAIYACARALTEDGDTIGAGQLTVAGVAAASLGSFPFYVAFAMPDILAPVLATLVAVLFARPMALTRTERITAVLIALFAIVAHPSHLLLTALVLPIALFASPFLSGRRIGFAIAFAALLIGGGLAERFAFGLAAEQFLHKRVLYLPFVTARLIGDGPGFDYLEKNCPKPDYATCTLYTALQNSDDPERLFAPNILFARSGSVASYAALSDDDKAAIASEQFEFAKDVVLADPGGVVFSLVRNTVRQLALFGVGMTIPSPDMVETTRKISATVPADLYDGRLISDSPSWLPPLTAIHGAVYVLSVGLIAWLWSSGRITRTAKSIVVVIIAAIVVNAFICGAISEPADRYGARMMYLLPMLAAMLVLVSSRRRA